jgi:outer membrane protein assembly factor BamB
MIARLRWSLAVALFCTLTACGTGDGNGSQDESKDEVAKQAAKQTTPAEKTTAALANLDDEFTAAPAVSGMPEDLAQPPSSTTEVASDDGAPFWPRFHGPKGDNISPDTGLLKEWPEGGPALIWKAEGLGDGYSSVTTANGLIYTAGNKDGKTLVTAVDLDGDTVWQRPNGAPWTGSFPGTRGTPTIDGDRVYHESPVGTLTCFNAKTGEEMWSVGVLEKFAGKNITWALAESVLIDGDNVITCPGGSGASVAALNKMTGETVWTAESTGEKANYATASLIEQNGLRMILTMTQKGFIAVNADNGKLLLKHPFVTKYDINVLKPLYHDGRIFLSGGYGTTGSQMLKLTVDGENASVEKVWESRELDNHHGGVILWDGYLYGAAHQFNRGKWVCLSWEDGEMQYAEPGVGKGSCTMADGLLYTMSEKSQVGLVAPTPAEHRVISTFKLPPGGAGPSWAHPVVIGGRLYIRHGDVLFAFDVKGA